MVRSMLPLAARFEQLWMLGGYKRFGRSSTVGQGYEGTGLDSQSMRDH